MRKLIAIYAAISIGIIFITSCGDSTENSQYSNQNTIVEDSDSIQKKSFVYTKYELPLSVDVYKFLMSKNIDFNKQYMHSLDKKEKYFTEVSRALVLGIYSSDLAYATIYDKSQEAVDYFGVSIDLAHKLDIEKGYDSKVLDRAYDNLDNDDSLSFIASEAYLKTCTNLEENNKANILPFIVLGSWLESIHVLSQASLGSSAEEGLFIELYKQKEHLSGMVNYLTDVVNISGNAADINDMKLLLNKLKGIQSKYEKIDITNPENIGVGQFKDVIFLVEDMRTGIIK